MNQSDRKIQLATKAGQIILENGGEVYRVEETATRIATACGAKYCDSFATPTVIILSMEDDQGHAQSHMRRVRKRTLDLAKVDAVNAFSRTLEYQQLNEERLDLGALERELDDIQSMPRYPLWLRALAASFATLGFAWLFQGTAVDCIATFFSTLCLFLVLEFLSKLQFNSFIMNIVSGALTIAIVYLCVKIGIPISFSLVTIAVIMLNVPGLTLTNAMRDIVAGDLLSGLSRLVEAVFIALGVAIGSGVVLKFISFEHLV